MVPFGLSTRWQAASQARLNSWLASGPRERSHAPLLTETILPAWHVMPSFERKYGGSLKHKAPQGFGRVGGSYKETTCWFVLLCVMGFAPRGGQWSHL